MEFVAFLIAVIGVIGLVSLVVVPAALIRGWVLATMWGWFIVPIFHLRPLRTVEAIGICVTVATFTAATKSEAKKDATTAEKATAFAMLYLSPLISLGIGWVVKQWM